MLYYTKTNYMIKNILLICLKLFNNIIPIWWVMNDDYMNQRQTNN